MSDDTIQEQTVEGRAENAKGGAVVVIKGDVVYIKGVPYWHEVLIGRDVVVKGVLTEEKLIPDPIIDEEGAISQGAEGMQTVISEAKWKCPQLDSEEFRGFTDENSCPFCGSTERRKRYNKWHVREVYCDNCHRCLNSNHVREQTRLAEIASQEGRIDEFYDGTDSPTKPD